LIIGQFMGFWFFLTVVVAGNMAMKVYKMRMFARERVGSDKAAKLEQEIAELRRQLAKNNYNERIEQLEEAVFFGDFELKRKFSKLESQQAKEPY